MIKGKYDYCTGTADRDMKRKVTALLNSAGFYNAGNAESTPELLRTLRIVQPWLVIVDVRLPPGNVENLASIIEEDGLAAAIYLNHACRSPVKHTTLSWPIDGSVLKAVAETLCIEFAHKRELRREIKELNRKLAGRRDIEKAKGLLMKKYRLNEEEAFQFLRKQSMDHRISLPEAARSILIASRD